MRLVRLIGLGGGQRDVVHIMQARSASILNEGER
jgi:hypothetical protein